MIRGFVIYGLTLLVLFTTWSMVLGYFPFLLCLLFVVLFFLSFIISFPAMRKTEVSLKTQTSIIQKGEKIKLVFHQESHSKIHCGQVVVFYQFMDAMGDCILRSSVRLHNQTEVIAAHVSFTGAYHVVIEKIYCFDILQCIFKKHHQESQCQFFVFPQYQQQLTWLDETTGFNNEANDYSPFVNGEDYSEVSHIRQYRDTDLLKHIHWKVTLKKNELYVKEGSQPIIKKILLTVQFCTSRTINDQSLEKFYSLCLSLVQKKIDFEILCPQSMSQYPSVELIKSDIYFKECFQRILLLPILNLDECLNNLKDYPDAYIVNAKGIEVHHR